MRKFTLLFVLVFTFAGFSVAQVIENFESLKMNAFDAGANGSVSVVANPDQTGINTSYYVGKMVRGFDGQPWAGWYATLSTPVDVTANKYVHIKIWKPRISPIVFKYERSDLNSGDVNPMNPQTLVGQWEEFVFDMSVVSGDYVKIVLIPDFENPLLLTEDIEIYFDDLYVNNDPTPGSAPVQVMEDFEHIPLNIMTGGPEDLSYFEMVPNPDKSGVNLSDFVIKFHRDKDGVSWGGFYSGTQIDVTDYKYMHVKAWKPRISPVKFKIEAGAAGTKEVASTNPQTETNVWVDYVFDFSDKTGTYPTIVFMPDFEDPLTLTEDIEIYFDDIILSNDPNPFQPPSLTINVDMTGTGDMTGVPMFIAGAFGGDYGTWNEPGTNPNNEMTDTDGDGIYSITMYLPDGLYAFKFFKGTGWGNGDPAPGGDRTLQYSGTRNVTYKWGVDGLLSIPQNPLAGQIKMYPNPVSDELVISTSVRVKEVTITSMLGQLVGTYQLNNNGRTTISTSGLTTGMYFVAFTGEDGSRQIQKLIKR